VQYKECLGLQYIAEHHENLGHIMVFFNVTGAIAGCNLEAEVSPLSGDDELLVVTCRSKATCPVRLPARSIPGKKEVKVQRGHFELQLRTVPPVTPEDSEHTALFDAAALVKYSPTSFICSSCSLPLVQSARVTEYKDLPSEHWEELVDAWMCHADQKLHDQVIKYATNGFWPRDGQALVGGSYIMFENRSVMEGNLRPVDKTKVSVQAVPSLPRNLHWIRVQRRSTLGHFLPTASCLYIRPPVLHISEPSLVSRYRRIACVGYAQREQVIRHFWPIQDARD
jgi:hypothetical protein